MAKITDIALIAGLGVLVFLITRAGRDLAGAFSGLQPPSINFPEFNINSNFTNPTDSIRQAIKDLLPGVDSGFESGPADQEFLDQEAAPVGSTPFNPPGGATIIQDESGQVSITPNEPVQGPIAPPTQEEIDINTFLNPTFPEPDAGQSPNVTSQIDNQQFGGGGPSFIGGTVFETPIENLSLNQIIERFGVGATEAADILARAQDNFGDFDFGTNTGTGIGSVFDNPELNTLLPSDGAVSNPEFEGLSAEQIALQLTGGNISNF